jgi:LmbE family N-acetylglucosaminyl deacetylase
MLTKLVQKIYQRITDPVFYRKRTRDLIRGFRSFDDVEKPLLLEHFSDLERAVVVVAHPDDEVFCSGLICELKYLGCHVTVLCLTRGEGGPCDGFSREELGGIRSVEMRESCDELGVDELVFLGHIDPVAKGFKVYAPDVSVEALVRQIRDYIEGADLVLSHGSSGEYWHPAHLLVFGAVKQDIDSIGERSPTWMTFLARQIGHPLPDLINWDDPAFLRVDNTPYQDARRRSLECHRSQLGLFGRFAGGDHGDFIRLTAREAYALQKWGDLKVAEAADKGKG